MAKNSNQPVERDLGEVGRLAKMLVAAEDEVERIERDLKTAQENARRLREEALPSAMDEVGLTKVVLSTGEEISTKLEVYAAIPVPRREEAYRWLDDHGHGGLIKTQVSVQFGREEREEAARLVEDLRGQDFPVELNMSVHAGTLKAWLKDLLSAEQCDVPLELFGARPVTVAKVKRP